MEPFNPPPPGSAPDSPRLFIGIPYFTAWLFLCVFEHTEDIHTHLLGNTCTCNSDNCTWCN